MKAEIQPYIANSDQVITLGDAQRQLIRVLEADNLFEINGLQTQAAMCIAAKSIITQYPSESRENDLWMPYTDCGSVSTPEGSLDYTIYHRIEGNYRQVRRGVPSRLNIQLRPKVDNHPNDRNHAAQLSVNLLLSDKPESIHLVQAGYADGRERKIIRHEVDEQGCFVGIKWAAANMLATLNQLGTLITPEEAIEGDFQFGGL